MTQNYSIPNNYKQGEIISIKKIRQIFTQLSSEQGSEKIEKLNNLITTLITLNPRSIFLYGSRSRTDFQPDSDFELGVIFNEENYISRSKINKLINNKLFSIYPFKFDEIINYKLDTPFQKTIYMNDLIVSAKTISGEKIIESLECPKIKIIDLIMEIRYCIGCALSAVLSDRNKDNVTAKNQFYKSCLYGLRTLIILKTGQYPLGYNQIFEFAKDLDLGEFEKLVNKAYSIRENVFVYDTSDLFNNLKFLNKFIEDDLIKVFEKEGNIELIKSK